MNMELSGPSTQSSIYHWGDKNSGFLLQFLQHQWRSVRKKIKARIIITRITTIETQRKCFGMKPQKDVSRTWTSGGHLHDTEHLQKTDTVLNIQQASRGISASTAEGWLGGVGLKGEVGEAGLGPFCLAVVSGTPLGLGVLDQPLESDVCRQRRGREWKDTNKATWYGSILRISKTSLCRTACGS